MGYLKETIQKTNEEYKDIYKELNLFGRCTLLPFLILGYPIVFLILAGMKDA